jgi:hypothetical protein
MPTNGFPASVQSINDVENRQRYSRLRERFKGSLKAKDGEKFIEYDRSKAYRISTHPDFVGLKHNMPLFKQHMFSLAKLCYL